MSRRGRPKWVRRMDYYTRETRTLPREAFDHESLFRKLKIFENAYRKGRLNRRKMSILGAYIRENFDIDYKILTDRHAIFLPRSNDYVYEKIYEDKPQLISIMGNRGTGKTITGWRLVRKFLEHYPDGDVYVYNDIDNMTPSFKHHFSKYSDNITLKYSKQLPPNDGKKKLVLYNELSEEMMGKRAMSDGNIDLNLQALKSRHRNTWVIYNVIRYSSLESTLRETADVELFKWCGAKLMKNIINKVPNPHGEIIKYTEKLTKNESLAFIPVEGKGTFMGIYETNPSKALLKAHRVSHEFDRPKPDYQEEEIDGLKLAHQLWELHKDDYDQDKYDKPAVFLSPGQGKKKECIPFSYANLGELVKEHPQSVARRVKSDE